MAKGVMVTYQDDEKTPNIFIRFIRFILKAVIFSFIGVVALLVVLVFFGWLGGFIDFLNEVVDPILIEMFLE